MRVRTAVATVAGIVVVKVIASWVVWTLWTSFPGRPGGHQHWHIELGPLSEWVGAVASAGAAIAALYIATRDRTDRKRERMAADEAQARLVLVEVSQPSGAPGFTARILNYGAQAIMDVVVDEADWYTRPGTRWKPDNAILAVVKPDREALSGGALRVAFVDADGNPVPKELERDESNSRRFEDAQSMPDVVVSFMDASGNHWVASPITGLQRDSVHPLRAGYRR